MGGEMYNKILMLNYAQTTHDLSNDPKHNRCNN